MKINKSVVQLLSGVEYGCALCPRNVTQGNLFLCETLFLRLNLQSLNFLLLPSSYAKIIMIVTTTKRINFIFSIVKAMFSMIT